MRKLITCMFLLLAGSTYTSIAQKAAVIVNDKTGWHKIAETMVNYDKETDEIMVLGADRFASIKFKVTDAPITLNSLVVEYESGDAQNIKLNAMVLKAETESRTIDLNGGERRLKKIIFNYKTIPNSADKKAHMEVWGYKTNADK